MLKLQAELDTIEKSLGNTRTTVSASGAASSITKAILDVLESRQQELTAKVQELYASLNVEQHFPELKGLDLEFVRTSWRSQDFAGRGEVQGEERWVRSSDPARKESVCYIVQRTGRSEGKEETCRTRMFILLKTLAAG